MPDGLRKILRSTCQHARNLPLVLRDLNLEGHTHQSLFNSTELRDKWLMLSGKTSDCCAGTIVGLLRYLYTSRMCEKLKTVKLKQEGVILEKKMRQWEKSYNQKIKLKKWEKMVEDIPKLRTKDR